MATYFVSNMHAQMLLDEMKKNKSKINDFPYCALLYVSTCPYPISSEESYFQEFFNQYVDIITNGLEQDIIDHVLTN